MRFGVKLPNLSPIGGRASVLTVARHAEALGFDTVWVSDHVVFPKAPDYHPGSTKFPVEFETPAIEPLITLAAVAGATERVKLGTSVLVAAMRNPVLLAKSWASLDDLSSGRVIAGIGTGWQEEEFAALGAGDRFRWRGSVTEEWVRILRTCWYDDLPEFHGRFYEFAPLLFRPRPVGRIPILLGASSERAIGRLARVGDGLHATNLTPDTARAMIGTIRAATEKEGRDPDQLIFTTLSELDVWDRQGTFEAHGDIHLAGRPDELVERIRAFETAGIVEIGLRVRALSGSTRKGVDTTLSLEAGLDALSRFAAEVMPHVRSAGGV